VCIGKSFGERVNVPRIDVLLATYNGERYLEQQLTSVLDQGVANVRVLIRDDGSTDGTPAIIERFARQCPGIVVPVRDSRGNLGVIRNFAALLDASDAPYAMFCDQDDVWLPAKIAGSLAEMQVAEAETGTHTPVLVYSDVVVADADARPTASSYYGFVGVDPGGRDLRAIMLLNRVIGCTAMLNRALIDGAWPIPPAARMHDWWFALYAAAFGQLRFINQGTMLYRQHGGNQVGARRYGLATLARVAPTRIANVRRNLHASLDQAACFVARFGTMLDPAQRAMLDAYAGLPKLGWLRRRWMAVRLGYTKGGLVRSVMFYLVV
jgi:glycosyltransferase involved in cell wall biosynthesis